jgi:hypothetical protein
MKRSLLVACAVLVGLVGSACSRTENDKEKVLDAIAETTPHSFRLDWTLTTNGKSVNVRGIIQDDFRYKLQLSLDGEAAAEQVVVDDGVALRFLDGDLVDLFTDTSVEGQVDLDTDVEGATVFDALSAGRWVLDEAGAPNAVITNIDASDDLEVERDPLFDARTALDYVRRVVDATPFILYDPESLDPTYQDEEDPFPAPEEGAGILRYDSAIADLPSAAAATGGDRRLPSSQNFRKMAVYVKDDVVIAVREFIGVSPRQLEELLDYEEALLGATAGDDVVNAFRNEIKRLAGDTEALTEFLLGGLNTFITSTGAQPIQFREMALEISDLDAVTTTVSLPTDVIRGDLAVIRNMGRKPLVDDDGGSESS